MGGSYNTPFGSLTYQTKGSNDWMKWALIGVAGYLIIKKVETPGSVTSLLTGGQTANTGGSTNDGNSNPFVAAAAGAASGIVAVPQAFTEGLVSASGQAATGLVGGLTSGTADVIKATGGGVAGIINSIGDSSNQVAGAGYNQATKGIGNVVNALSSGLGYTGGLADQLVKSGDNYLLQTGSQVVDTGKNVSGGVVAGISGIVTGSVNTLKNDAGVVSKGVSNVVSQVSSAPTNALKAVTSKISPIDNNNINGNTSVSSGGNKNVAVALPSGISSALKVVSTTAKSADTSIGKGVSGIVSAANSNVTKAVSGVSSQANALKGSISSVISHLF
jgi:hypothetical protein